MCRNIKTLFNFEPPATEAEIQASALQFVRKLSGFNKPSQGNAAAFDRAVIEVSDAARRLLTSLQTQAPARDRETEAQKARWGLATVRTDPTASKHAGLSMMVIDMQAPGVTVRPLRQINGDEEFNEVYLDDVMVPDEAVVGAVRKRLG